MLKTVILAAGTLLAATLTAGTPAAASTHHAYRTHRGLTAHGVHVAHSRSAVRVRSYAGTRLRTGRVRTTRLRSMRVGSARHGVALAYRGIGHHHRRRFAAANRDAMIQRYVGPRSAYAETRTPVSGAQVGGASYYGGGRTASGGRVGSATCAHRSLPFGTRVLVTNLNNARTAVLTVNDRGPFVRGRIVDVSVGAAGALGMLHSGTARVSVQVVGGPG